MAFVLPACLLVSALLLSATPAALADDDDDDDDDGRRKVFQRIATFPVFLNNDPDPETAAGDPASAEIVAAAEDGHLLIYTDGGEDRIGFVDISDPDDPQPDGLLGVDGEPTSVAVAGDFALVAVNTSPSFVAPSGKLQIVDIGSRNIVRTIELGGQPDAIAVSPDERYAGIAIENERDEDAGDGRPPQDPPGFFVIIDIFDVDDPAGWGKRDVSFLGIPDKFPEDPEPEFVAINDRNVAAVTLQENNYVILVKLSDGSIVKDWSAGEVDLRKIDIEENDLIQLTGRLDDVPREPDAITAIGKSRFGTADEGDLDGGSRGFTIFDRKGRVRFAAGNSVEHQVVRIGHYPENRSENKGNEPEGIAFADYGKHDFLFVGSERSSVVLVYRLRSARGRPKFLQTLPTGLGPEGLLAIPERDLLVVSSEVEDLDEGLKFRSSLTLYELVRGEPTYPTIQSANRRGKYRYGWHDDDDDDGRHRGRYRYRGRHGGLPIPWGALSALAGDRYDRDTAYTAYDSFYRESRIFEVDVGERPALIVDEIVLEDDGETVDLDVEGVATRKGGGFWVVSEGSGAAGDGDETLNLLLEVASDGEILETIQLPDSVNALQRRFGFEGVTATGEGGDELVYVAFQREWDDDPDDRVRIGRYDPNAPEDQAWRFFYYPLDAPESTTPIGSSWVGLSEIVALDEETFAVIERDNQGGTSAAIKRIYEFSIEGLEPAPQGEAFPQLSKTLVRDLIPDLEADNGAVIEKVEGLGVLANGDAIVVTDNDGVDDSNGETQFLNLGDIFELGGTKVAENDDD